MKNILGKKHLFLIAHPDDETFTSAGTIYRNTNSGGETVVVCATLGEQGSSHLHHPVPKTALKKIRKQELEQVSEFLGVQYLRILSIPDTKVNEHKNTFYKKVFKLALKHKPDYIFSFDEFGISGHIDHIATAQVAKKLAKKLKIPLITFTLPKRFHISVTNSIESRRKNGKYRKNIQFKDPNLTISIDPKIKQKAFALHASQHDDPKKPFPNFPKGFIETIHKKECFVMQKPLDFIP